MTAARHDRAEPHWAGTGHGMHATPTKERASCLLGRVFGQLGLTGERGRVSARNSGVTWAVVLIPEDEACDRSGSGSCAESAQLAPRHIF